MKQAFLLRQLAYQSDEVYHDLINTESIMDIDGFDGRSHHFVAMNESELAAYIRLSMPNETSNNPWVNEIADDHQIDIKARQSDFPFQQYFPAPDWATQFLSELKSETIGEVGKLCIHPEYRQEKNLLEDFISSFIEYAVQEQSITTGFGICTLTLERFYKKFGFYRPEGTEPFTHGGLPPGVLLRFDP